MEIRINRSDFLSELTPMQGIVERKSTIPVLSHLLLEAKDLRLAFGQAFFLRAEGVLPLLQGERHVGDAFVALRFAEFGDHPE